LLEHDGVGVLVEDLESLTAFCEPLRERAAVVTRLALVEVDRYQFEVNGGLFPRAGEDVEERVAVLSTRNGDEDPVAASMRACSPRS
jgi:hypothetical protein